VFTERTSIGLDVHARSVVAAAIDGVTGEVSQTRLTPSYEHIQEWIKQLPGPVAVAYEAGPTGFGLYRALTDAGVRCEVVAPSKLQRPAGDRVKTDARDALHLARLLRLDEVTSVSIPSVNQEACRDLVRAREDCRGDLMRARHRLSKLLLRHGIVYPGGAAWTDAHDRWLRAQAVPQLLTPATRMAFDSDYEHVLMLQARRRGLDSAIEDIAADSEFTPVVRRVVVPSRSGHVDRVRVGSGGWRLGSIHRQHDWFVRRIGALGVLVGFHAGARTDHQDRKHSRAAAAGRGGLASPAQVSGQGGNAFAVGPGPRGGPRSWSRGQPSSPQPMVGIPGAT